MVLWVFRALFVLASSATAYSIGYDLGRPFVFLVGGIFLSFAVIAAEWFVSRGPIALISSIVFGALLGMLFATLTVSVIGLAVEKQTMDVIRDDVTGALIVAFSYLGIAFIYQSRDKFNLIVPYVEFRRQEKGQRPVVIDTSVIIDGRIADILETGIMDGPLLIPEAVLHELHQLADSGDKLKRERGRLGLEVLNQIRDGLDVDVRIQETTADQSRTVDEELVRLAKMVNGRLMTTDFNLNRRASVEGISVVNLHALANALKPIALPDEQLRIKLLKRGEQPGQAIGYLPDGTMVIVEAAAHLVGQEVDVIVRNTFTKDTGRIIFARAAGE
ncbi:MAG: PIN/TRAM domain-containing protein [Candidatus Brocadiae bacterium]|nr:PIN/TRAM domain-containing protein [Candidatus Brocadiia bacterium]